MNSAFFYGYMAMSLPGGWLAAKYGSHRTITVGKHAACCGVTSTLRGGGEGRGTNAPGDHMAVYMSVQ